jgi:uncharacterized membrane protein YjfL (UPF0719 family)
MSTILISVAQFAVAIILSALAAYVGLWLFERSTRGIDEWKALRSGNQAIGLVLAAVVVGLAIILQPAVAGALPDQAGRLAPDLASSARTMLTLLVILIRAGLGLVLGIIAILFAMWLFVTMTRDVDEMAEIHKGNMAVALMLAGVILTISILTSPLVASVSDSLLLLFFP